MNSIIKRMDDLGRIGIPREIRRKLSIEEGDALEIYVSGENIVLQKVLTKAEKKEKWIEQVFHEKRMIERKQGYNFQSFIVQNNTILFAFNWEKRKFFASWATCAPEDMFDKKTGIAVAFAKMACIDIPEYI